MVCAHFCSLFQPLSWFPPNLDEHQGQSSAVESKAHRHQSIEKGTWALSRTCRKFYFHCFAHRRKNQDAKNSFTSFFLLAYSCSSQPSRTQSTCSLSIRSWTGSSDRKDATALGFSQQDILTSIRVLWSNEAIVLIPFIASLNFELCQFTAPSTNLDQPHVRQICRVLIDNDSRPEHKPTPSSCVSMATHIPWNCPNLSSFNSGHFEWSASKAEALPYMLVYIQNQLL